MKKPLVAFSIFLAAALVSQAQVLYTSGTYSQNFDGLFGVVPADNTLISHASILPTGWNVVESGANSNTDIRVHSGVGTGGTTGDSFLYGAAGSNERALGSYASGSMAVIFGFHLQNNSASTLTQFTLTFDGEQWLNGRNASAIFNTQAFSYGIGNASITAGSFTNITALDFTAVQGGTTGGDIALDGNDPANRTANISFTVTGINWAPGQALWLRWNDPNDAGNDDGLAVDNVRFTAVPEPGVGALVFGGCSMLWVLRRRRQVSA